MATIQQSSDNFSINSTDITLAQQVFCLFSY